MADSRTVLPSHRKRAELIIDLMRGYPPCQDDADRANWKFDAELLAQHLAGEAESVRYSTERGARQELWSFIRLHAGKTETQNVSVEWLDAFAPELVSGRFADISARLSGGKEQGEHG